MIFSKLIPDKQKQAYQLLQIFTINLNLKKVQEIYKSPGQIRKP